MPDADPLLVGLRLAGRRVVVVGGGSVGERRVQRFLDAGASVTLVAPLATPALQALAGAARITWERREALPSDLDGAWLAHVCTGDAARDASIAGWAEERRVWCIVASDGVGTPARMLAQRTIDVDGQPAVVAVTTGRPTTSRALLDRFARVVAADRSAQR